jgi:hypothetical protein
LFKTVVGLPFQTSAMKPFLALCLLALLSGCSDYGSPNYPPPELQTVAVVYCDGFAPLWVAFQDGDGPWTRVQPTAANGNQVFQYSFASNHGAVASVRDVGGGLTLLHVLLGRPDELASIAISGPRACGATDKTLLGTIAGVESTDLAIVRGGFFSEAQVLGGGSFTLDALPAGPRDILVERATTIDGAGPRLSQLLLRRGVDLPDHAQIPPLDFNSPEAFEPVLPFVTLEGVGQDDAFLSTRLRTSNFDNTFSIPIPGPDGSVRPYYAIPEARLAAGELQALTVEAHGGTPGASRTTIVYFRAPADRTLVMGPDVSTPEVSVVATAPTLRLRARFVNQDAYDRETSVVYATDGPRPGFAAVSMTAAYATSTGGYDLVIPELSGVAGFDRLWALATAASVRWSATRLGGTLGLGFDPVPTDGAVRRSASASAVLTP